MTTKVKSKPVAKKKPAPAKPSPAPKKVAEKVSKNGNQPAPAPVVTEPLTTLPPPPEKELALDRPDDLEILGGLAVVVEELMAERVLVTESVKKNEARKKELDQEIREILAEVNAGSIVDPNTNFRAAITNSKTGSSISAQKLLEKGVAADVIAACTIPGKPYTYLLFKSVTDKD